MKIRTLLFKKGLFTAGLDRDSLGSVPPQDYDYVYLWRKVLDEMVIAMIGTNTSAAEHSRQWFNARPGDIDFYKEEDTFEEIQVDMWEEYKTVCDLACLDPYVVTQAANIVAERAKEELDEQ